MSEHDIQDPVASQTDEPETDRTYARQFCQFAPNNKGTGCKLELSAKPPSERTGVVFLTLTPQMPDTKVGDKKLFDYDNKCVFALNSLEVSKMISVLKDRTTKVTTGDNDGLFHKKGDVTKKLYFSWNDKYKNYSIMYASGDVKIPFFLREGQDVLVEDWLTRSLAVIEPV